MGKIVAAPTAGACGILPAALLTLQEQRGYSDGQVVDALFTAAAVGAVIAARASISGAEGGCQAECGSAAAMAAAAVCELCGGAAAGGGRRGGVCADEQHGPGVRSRARFGRGAVRIPQRFRCRHCADGGGSGAERHRCPLEPDDVVDAMKAVGEQLPASLRETGEGGCAACRVTCPAWEAQKE